MLLVLLMARLLPTMGVTQKEREARICDAGMRRSRLPWRRAGGARAQLLRRLEVRAAARVRTRRVPEARGARWGLAASSSRSRVRLAAARLFFSASIRFAGALYSGSGTGDGRISI